MVSARFSSNSEAFDSELKKNHEEMFPRCMVIYLAGSYIQLHNRMSSAGYAIIKSILNYE